MNIEDLFRGQKFTRKADAYILGCPICRERGNDHTGDHLIVYPDGRFGCIADQSKEHYRAIYDYLYKDGEKPEFVEPAPRVVVERVYSEDELKRLLPDYSYWVGRGITEATMRRFEGGLAPEGPGKLNKRFCFPCRNIKGRIIGWAGRLVEENRFAPKWKIIGAKRLFVYNKAMIDPYIRAVGEVVLVEGIGDCLALADVSIYQVLPIFGLSISSAIICYLASLPIKRIIIATNNEATKRGNVAAEKLKGVLDQYFDNVVISLPPVKDFLQATPDERRLWIEKTDLTKGAS